MHRTQYPNFSVIMSVYAKDTPDWFQLSIDSLLRQTVQSNDIIIVADGPLTRELDDLLAIYEKEENISVIRLEKNKGLGNALNVALAKVKNELVARMDSDDISLPNRFELQLAEFMKNPKLDIVGGQIAEFVDNPDKVVSYRNVPTTQEDIEKFSKRRSPFNHPTVIYKKSTIQKLGGYDVTAIRVEDYDLWLRTLASGALCANTSEVILSYRSTPDTMKRRRTFSSWKNHMKARTRFYNKGYISFIDFCYGVLTQTILLVAPRKLSAKLFNRVVR